jgi:hypothetical protein
MIANSVPPAAVYSKAAAYSRGPSPELSIPERASFVQLALDVLAIVVLPLIASVFVLAVAGVVAAGILLFT